MACFWTVWRGVGLAVAVLAAMAGGAVAADGSGSRLAALFGGLSSRGRRTQTGYARSYALSMFVGSALVVGALLLVRL